MQVKKIPEAELEIMNLIWNSKEELSSKEISSLLLESKGWKTTTVLTLISRLVEKEFLTVYKQGRLSYYKANVEESDYIKLETHSFFKKLHKGSLKNFIVTLHENNDISDDDLDELDKWIKSR